MSRNKHLEKALSLVENLSAPSCAWSKHYQYTILFLAPKHKVPANLVKNGAFRLRVRFWDIGMEFGL